MATENKTLDKAQTQKPHVHEGEEEVRGWKTGDEILAYDDMAQRELWVPWWKTYVNVRQLDANEWLAVRKMMNQLIAGTKTPDLYGYIVSRCATGQHGQRLFPQVQVPKIQKKSPQALDFICSTIIDMSSTSEEEKKEILGNLGLTHLDAG